MRRWSLPSSYPTPVLVLVLALSSVGIAWLSFNLVMLAMANTDFLRRHGVMAAVEGGLVQLVVLAAKGMAALALYLLFRGAEREILRRWTGND